MKIRTYSFNGGQVPSIGRFGFTILSLLLTIFYFVVSGAYTIIEGTAIFYHWPLPRIMVIFAFPILQSLILQLRVADIAASGRIGEEYYILAPVIYFGLAIIALFLNKTVGADTCILGDLFQFAAISQLLGFALWRGAASDQ